MKVGLKYCGGCDPTYDRPALVQRIKSEAGDSFVWSALNEEDYDAVLLVCGCLRACPEDELQQFSPVTIKSDLVSPEQVAAQLRGKGKIDEDQD
jgi:hypothetical protein